VRPYAAAIREKDLGIWQSWSWLQVLQEVREIAAGCCNRASSAVSIWR
jgi:long-chain acyl-CoA synthetase